MKSVWMACVAGAAIMGLAGCAGENWNIERRNPKEVHDLDYRFDEDDAREVANAMIADCLSRPWIDRWEASHDGKRPLIVVGNVSNNTQDYINTELFTDPIQKELLNSGRVRVKAQKDLRNELRDERLDTKFNDPATVKAIAKEVNADYMLVGRVADNKERSGDGRQVISYYKVTLELIDIETAEKTWIGDHDIEKGASR
jgi:uncharacterized protein (TIGR02722 family)